MKKKLIIGIFIFIICCIFFPHFVRESKYLYSEYLPKVKIKETFTGDIDNIIDEFILNYIESTEQGYDDFVPTVFLRPVKNKYNEFETVVHHTFNTKTSGNEITYYIVYRYGDGNFVNGVFAHYEYENVPVSITFKKVGNRENEYKVTKIFFQKEGFFYPELNEIFDDKIIEKYKSENYNEEIKEKLYKRKKAYLKSIGRNEKMTENLYLEYIMEDVEFAENGYDYMCSDDSFIFDFEENKGYPAWIGTIERLKGGKRYIYKAEQQVIDKKRYIITYTMTDESGNILEQYKVNANSRGYKIKKVV